MGFKCPKCGGSVFGREGDAFWCNSDIRGVPLSISSGSRICGWMGSGEECNEADKGDASDAG